jgi:hypothetical protein
MLCGMEPTHYACVSAGTFRRMPKNVVYFMVAPRANLICYARAKHARVAAKYESAANAHATIQRATRSSRAGSEG